MDPNVAEPGTAPALLLAAQDGAFGVIRVFKEHKVMMASTYVHIHIHIHLCQKTEETYRMPIFISVEVVSSH